MGLHTFLIMFYSYSSKSLYLLYFIMSNEFSTSFILLILGFLFDQLTSVGQSESRGKPREHFLSYPARKLRLPFQNTPLYNTPHFLCHNGIKAIVLILHNTWESFSVGNFFFRHSHIPHRHSFHPIKLSIFFPRQF